jgi:hypothetical protein
MTLDYLSKFKREMQNAVMDQNPSRYAQNHDLFLRGQNYFLTHCQKPPKLSKEELNIIHQENIKLRRKYQAEELAKQAQERSKAAKGSRE